MIRRVRLLVIEHGDDAYGTVAIRNLRPTANNRSLVGFDKCGHPVFLVGLAFWISDVIAVNKPPRLDGVVEEGFGADAGAVVLLLTVDFFAWRFRLPRD